MDTRVVTGIAVAVVVTATAYWWYTSTGHPLPSNPTAVPLLPIANPLPPPPLPNSKAPAVVPSVEPPPPPVVSRTGRWVRIDRASAGYLHVAEIIAWRPGGSGDRIPAVAAAMTMPPYAPTMGPEKIMDGNPKSFAHTKDPKAVNTFIEIDLGADTAVGALEVWNRTDCCSDRLLAASVSLLDATRKTVWTRPFLTIGPRYRYPMVGADVRRTPALAFALDASAPGTLFSDADGRMPAVAGGPVRRWSAADVDGSAGQQSLTLSRDARWLPNAFGGTRPAVVLGGAEGVYALPTLPPSDPVVSDGGATLVVVCALNPDASNVLGGGGHPWTGRVGGGEEALAARGLAVKESFHSSAPGTWTAPETWLTRRVFVYAVVADPVTGITSSFFDDGVVRHTAEFRWRGADPARMSAWYATLAELRVYRGVLGNAELVALMTDLKAKWGWQPVNGPQSHVLGPYGREPWGSAAAFAVPSAQWIFGPGGDPTTWPHHRHECVVTVTTPFRAVLHVLAQREALVWHNNLILGVTPADNWLTPTYPRYDVALTTGQNVLRFDLTNDLTGGAGLCVALVRADTGAVVVKTDSTSHWTWARHTPLSGAPSSPPAPTDAGTGEPVAVLGPFDLAPFGAGAFPVPSAKWVWSASGAHVSATAGEVISFSGTFSATTAGTATLHVRVDNLATLYVNGAALGGVATPTAGRWRIPVQVGSNVITAVAINTSTGPAGFIAGVVSDTDGTKVLTQTDATWRYVRHLP